MAYPNTPTATAASRSARSWSISTRASGLMVAVFLGCRSFCTAETEAHTFDVTSITGVNCSHELITQGRNIASRSLQPPAPSSVMSFGICAQQQRGKLRIVINCLSIYKNTNDLVREFFTLRIDNESG